jgi:hypothetical protein
VAIVFAVVTGLIGSAHAITLRITEGEILGIQVLMDIFSDFGATVSE